MAWYSEMTDLHQIARGVRKEIWTEFREAWYTDLQVLVEAPSKLEAMQAAQAYLKYYGARTHITDIGWDLTHKCFKWEILDLEFDRSAG
jgi:hypothetical protein